MITKLRIYANLPTSLSDDFLNLHLKNAQLEFQVDVPSPVYGTANKERMQEAIICKTLCFLIPAANTFFVEGMPALNAESVESRFFSPLEQSELIARYDRRYWQLIRILNNTKAKKGWFLL